MPREFSLSIKTAIIDGQCFRVREFPREDALEMGPNALQKGVAYHIKTDMTDGLFPYRGLLGKNEKWSPYTAKVGVYLRERKDQDGYQIMISYPRDKKTKSECSVSNIKDILSGVLDHQYAADQFIDLNINESKGDAFMPPIRVDDDYLNTLMKLGIRLKEAPFEIYGRRLEATAADRSKKIEGVNIRNNTKRMLNNNSTMSPNKSKMVADNWQMELAVILRDMPGAMDPMFPDSDDMLILYPGGMPFQIDPDKLINATDMINDAIADSNDHKNDPDDDEED